MHVNKPSMLTDPEERLHMFIFVFIFLSRSNKYRYIQDVTLNGR